MLPGSQEAPFRTIVSPHHTSAEPGCPGFENSEDAQWTPDDLEAAYQRALEAADLAETLASVEIAQTEAARPAESDVPHAVPQSEPAAVPEVPTAEVPRAPVTPRQVVEALLFVGGEPLTGKRLADLLGGGFTHEQVDDLIAGMNRQYSEEGRPYEVSLAEGGYRLQLAPEFEPVRSRVYGMGPRDVKLSQDTLEVLAFIAYRQPVSRAALDETGKANVGAILRQLLRRELISLERTAEDEDVRYRTTPRFLELFGLREIEDLPQPDDLMFK